MARMFILMPEAQKEGTPKRIRDLALEINIIDLFTVVWILIASISPEFYNQLLSM